MLQGSNEGTCNKVSARNDGSRKEGGQILCTAESSIQLPSLNNRQNILWAKGEESADLSRLFVVAAVPV